MPFRRSFTDLFLLLLFVIAFSNRALAYQQSYPELIKNKDFVKDVQQAIDSVYNMNQPASNKILAAWKQKYPKDPIWIFWNGLETWWKILPDLENTSLDKKMLYEFSKTDYECTRILSDDPDNLDALVVKAASNGFMARLHANRTDWVQAFNNARKAKDALDRIQELDPTMPDIKFGLGIYKYYVAWLPEAFPVLKSVMWMLPDGNKSQGLRMLNEAAHNSVFVQPEALYMLGRIYYEGEHNTGESINYFLQLVKRYPDNGYYKRVVVHLYFMDDHYGEAMSLIDRYLAEADQHQAPFNFALKEGLLGLKGRIQYLLGDYDTSARAFKQSRDIALSSPMGKNREHYLMACYYLGEIYKKKNDRDKAESYLREVSKSSVDSPYVSLARKALKSLD